MTLGTTRDDEATSFAEYAAIAATLQRYIDGARAGDVGQLRLAFLEGASIRGSYDGKPVDWSLQDFCEVVERGGRAPDLQARIVAMDYAGTAAAARLEAENWRGTRYTDFFLLLRQNDGWRISDKVFFAHSRS